MKAVSVLTGAIGLAMVAGLVFYFGAVPIGRALLAVGSLGFVAICLIHLALIGAMGVAWWTLLRDTNPWVAIWARLVRDSASEVLPLSQVGGYVFGARALAVAGVSGCDTAASTIVDVTLEFLAQLAYTGIALYWLLHLDPHSQAAWPVATGLAVASGLAGGFIVAQRRGFGLLDRFARTLSRGWAEQTAGGARALHAGIAGIYARSRGIWMSFVVHLGCWIAAVVEIWLALTLMGEQRGFGVVLVIESLLYAVRSIAFAVPNAFGVQEGAYIVLGAGFGLPPDIALALSLLKRARDFVIGAPALGIYQLIETGRLWHFAGKAAIEHSVVVGAKPGSR